MLYSFYGGQPGQSFTVSRIFNNKCELLEDLKSRWKSTIAIGEYVFISYGLADTGASAYQENLELDKETWGKNYNTTLWQKIYTEATGTVTVSSDEDSTTTETTSVTASSTITKNSVYLNKKGITLDLETLYVSGNFGVGYQLIAVLAGSAPSITIKAIAEAANYTAMEVEEDKSDLNSPVYTLHLPQSQVLQYDEETDFKATAAGTTPTFELDSSDINNPRIKVTIPLSLVLLQGETTVLDADEDPSFEINNTDINNPVINFSLPQSQVLLSENVSTVILGPNALPTLTVDTSSDDEKINTPTAEFGLPRAAQYVYGTAVTGGRDNSVSITVGNNSTLASLLVGDYYINSETGWIYEVIEGEEGSTTKTLTFKACFDPPKPDPVTASTITPFVKDSSGNYSVNSPSVISEYADASNNTGWKLTFLLPVVPTIALGETQTLGPAEDASVVSEISSENGYTYTFSIPRGSRVFSGSEVDSDNLSASIEDAKPGDVYVNTNFGGACDGYIYELDSSGAWNYTGSIKGSAGNPLNILTTVEIDGSAAGAPNDTLSEVSNYLSTTLGLSPSSSEIIAVNYSIDGSTTAYWYYCIDGTWYRSQLTGGVENLIENTWTSEALTGKAYSISAINNMLVGTTSELTSGSTGNQTIYTVARVDELLDEIVVSASEGATLTDTEKASKAYSVAAIDELLQDASMAWGSWNSSGNLIDSDGNFID